MKNHDVYWKRKAFSNSRYDKDNTGFYKEPTIWDRIKNYFVDKIYNDNLLPKK